MREVLPRTRMDNNSSIEKLDWTNEIILEFIQLYESHPVLWDPNHKNHKNRKKLYDAWQNIAKKISIDVTVDALRKKKESLMSTYRTLAKKVRDSCSTGSGTRDMYEPTWFAYHAIDRFITVSTKKTPSLSPEERHNEQLSEEESFQNEEENTGLANDDNIAREVNQNKNYVLPENVRRKRGRGGLSKPESSVEKYLKHASDLLTSLAMKSKTQQIETLQDVPELYGQLLAAKLRRLPKRTQLILQNQIDNLVFQAEINEIDNHSCASTSETGSNISCTPDIVLSQDEFGEMSSKYHSLHMDTK